MARETQPKKPQLTKIGDLQMTQINAYFKRPILRDIMRILCMEHGGFRTYKSVKNINRLFTDLDMSRYKNNIEMQSYVWCIRYMSKQWLDGIVNPELMAEGAKRHPEYDNVKEGIIERALNDPNIIQPPEAKAIFDLVSEALQFGYLASMKDEYINLLGDIDISQPGAFREVVERLFLISKSLIDIKHNTNLVANKISFNTSDMTSVANAIGQTISSLSRQGNMIKMGIRRWNTLLSPAYMNGALYTYAGAPGSGKSVVLLKTALDCRKYNPGFIPRTPGMRPCCLYVTMENTFTETIERMWNMTFDEPITNYGVDEAVSMLCKELGIMRVLNDDVNAYELDEHGNKAKKLEASLLDRMPAENDPNIEIVVQYYPYREISTDDLFTIISDLRDEGMECCMLVFDYIKRIRPATPQADNVKLELNRIINELKALAVIEDIPVITAHQLNRTAVAAMDSASRQGHADVIKLAGREHIGDAYEVLETSDFLALVNIEYKPGTNERYLTLNVQKRRRIDQSEAEFAKYTYLAHPFAKNNGMRLLDDMHLDKVLSLKSLASDIDVTGAEKTNAVPRLKSVDPGNFVEDDEF